MEMARFIFLYLDGLVYYVRKGGSGEHEIATPPGAGGTMNSL